MQTPVTHPKPIMRGTIAVLLACATSAALACDFPGLDAAADLALHAMETTLVQAAPDRGRAPTIVPDRPWEVELHPKETVSFIRPPGRDAEPATHAGLLRFRVPAAGRWRLALSDGSWVDLVDQDETVPSARHGGDGRCTRMHKVVDFDLPAAREVIIQVSGARAARLRLSLRAVQ